MTNEQLLSHYRDDSKLPYLSEVVYTVTDVAQMLDAAREDEAIRFNNWIADNYDFFEFGEPGKRWGKFWEDEEAGTEGFEVIEMPTLYQQYKKTKPMTLSKEEIEMIEREAKEYSEIFAMHDRESVCAGFMEGAAVYYHIVKAERERAGKLMEALGVAKEYFDDKADCDYQGDPLEPVPNNEMKLLSEIQAAINEYNNTRS